MGRPDPAKHQTAYPRDGHQGTLSQQEFPTLHRYLSGRTFSRADSICGLRSRIQTDRRQKRALSSALNREKIAAIRVWPDRPNRCRRQKRRRTGNGALLPSHHSNRPARMDPCWSTDTSDAPSAKRSQSRWMFQRPPADLKGIPLTETAPMPQLRTPSPQIHMQQPSSPQTHSSA